MSLAPRVCAQRRRARSTAGIDRAAPAKASPGLLATLFASLFVREGRRVGQHAAGLARARNLEARLAVVEAVLLVLQAILRLLLLLQRRAGLAVGRGIWRTAVLLRFHLHE